MYTGTNIRVDTDHKHQQGVQRTQEYSTEPMLSEHTDESPASQRTGVISIRRQQFSQLPVERAEVEEGISPTGWKTKRGLTTAGNQWRVRMCYPSTVDMKSIIVWNIKNCNVQ